MLPELAIWITAFVVSLTVLIKASDFFTDAAEEIGLMLGISPFIVGVTIVACGTSLPELLTSFAAVLNKSTEIVAGNVVGSNVANILLILGVAAVVGKRLKINRRLLRIDIPLLLVSSLALAITVYDGVFDFAEAVLFVGGFIMFVIYTVNSGNKVRLEREATGKKRKAFSMKQPLILLLSGGGVYLGASYTIESVIRISELLLIGKEVIAVTAVAIGTSLPELGVTMAAIKKKNSEMIVGNVLGSNIFNTFAVMGLPGLTSNLIVPDIITNVGIPVMIGATLLFLFGTFQRRVTRIEGLLFFVFYSFFIVKMFVFS